METTRRRLAVTLLIIWPVLLLAGALLFPTAAVSLAHGLFTGAGRDGAENGAIQQDSDWHIETVDSYSRVGSFTSLALDAWGYPHISYYDSFNGNLKYARWDGLEWHIETVDSSPDVGRYTSLALDEDGYPSISYQDAGTSNLKYARWDGLEWHIETVDFVGVGRYTSLALDGSDYPHISYCDHHNGDLKYARRDDSAWHLQTVDSDQSVGQYTSLALDRSNYPHISYFDDTNGDLKYACWDGLAWHIETVDSTGYVGEYTSLALDTAGYPHISYYDNSNGDLKHAYWDGSGWRIEVVDDGGYVGTYTSLALDVAGYPHISYTKSPYELRYAYWDGWAWRIETVDRSADVGLDNSLAVDASGYPHISYYDQTNADLKYARKNIQTTVRVYTDKISYSVGETMHLGVDMTTRSAATPGSYWLLILLRTPSTGVVLVNLPALPLPPGWSYSNPDFLTFPLPALESGTYTWIGMLIPVGEEPAVDSAIWTFTGGEASGQRVVPVEKALEQLGEVDLNLGK